MKRILITLAVLAAALILAVPAQAQSPQLLQGTQVKLILQHGLSSSVAREGDPFTAVVAEPVYMGDQLLLPAGAKVNGEIGTIIRPRRFAIFRGQAAMGLYIRSIEIDHREIPAPMSIVSIHETSGGGMGKRRKDLNADEGAIVYAKRDIKGDIKNVGLGSAGGTAVGAVFSHVMRGFVIGLVGSSAYIVVKKGKEVELPAQTGLLVRMDSTVTLPSVAPAPSPHVGQP